MSWEGYYQCICKNGHYFVVSDVYSEEINCLECNAEPAWENVVDDTNCDSDGVISMQDIDRLLVSPAKSEICNLGHSHQISPAIYRIPGEREMDPYRQIP